MDKKPPAQAVLLVESTMLFLRNRAAVLNVPVNPAIHFPDKKDIPILSLLEASSPHYLVTGDKRLLELKKFRQTLILTAREALGIL